MATATVLKATNIYEGTKKIAKQTIRGNYSRLSGSEHEAQALAWGDLRYLDPERFTAAGVSEEEIGPSGYLEHNPGWLPAVFTALVYYGWDRGSLFFDTSQPKSWTDEFTDDVARLGCLLMGQSVVPRRIVNSWASLSQIQRCVSAGWTVSKEYHSGKDWNPQQAINYCNAVQPGRFMVICNVPKPLDPAMWEPMVRPIAEVCRQRGQYLCVRESGSGKEVLAADVVKVLR